MSSFVAINWAPNSLITNDSMQQINSNMKWLRDNTPATFYDPAKRTSNIGFMCGRVRFPPNKSVQTAQIPIYFNGFFSAGVPVITQGASAKWAVAAGQRLHLTMQGISTAHPDLNGFRFYINVNAAKNNSKNDNFGGEVWANWIAMGLHARPDG